MRRVRGRGGVGVLLRRRGRAVRLVRPPRAPRQQAGRQAPPVLAAQPGAAVLIVGVVGAAGTASALRHLPGSTDDAHAKSLDWTGGFVWLTATAEGRS